ncbi:FAD binding domain-containing protein [Aminobacter aganoensis]|uniref:Carbon-monoxide dehydrogenase medium subunit n=1 Tax=Aminobacter aganoensis TaxID=83264 RepID=A0A7X0F6G1_9HYPH|nr:FAD binding domain-containing protein [Aminobacter aganoensis]MBB6354018.1 carbon-monoxide dehydrogenase medium subunit [Aminobacter aganoensis]
MKPSAYRYARPSSVAEAVRLLADSDGGGKVMAGGQSLGPMLNLRLAQPELVVDITGIGELASVREDKDGIVYGACVTHAAVEDNRVPDAANGFLARVAAGIAYRAVRNRGTMGGSLAHADPSADWMTTLTAVDAEMLIAGATGERRVALAEFMTAPFSVALDEAEFIVGIRIRRHSPAARFGYFKFCRKRGEFAEAMAAIVVDPAAGVSRAVIGATDSRPIVLPDISAYLPLSPERLEAAKAMVEGLGIAGEPIKDAMHANAFARALQQVKP